MSNDERYELQLQLRKFRNLVNEARATGLNDTEIMQILGLQPRGLGKQTREVLQAIHSGAIKPKKDGSIRPVDVANYFGKTRGTAIYHLTKLKEAGYLK